MIDVEDALNKKDAKNLMGFFIGRGFVNKELEGTPASMPVAVPFDATQIIKAEIAGLISYHVKLGARVQEGDLIANILLLDGENAFRQKMPIYAGTSGIVFSLMLQKYIWKGAMVAKIAGNTSLASRKGVLLEA